MNKRLLAMLLSLLLVLSILPFGASAATQEEKQRVAREVSRDYYSSLYCSGRKDLAGYCGLMTSWQLYFMDINDGVYIYDGNKQFDHYSKMVKTTGGHTIKSYSAEQYTLEEALNAITRHGTRDVYNLLVGFQWTNTSAGAYYGHAVVVYAILDGIVYFTEGFSTSFGTAAGQCIKIPIAEFAEYYDDWTRFEGVVVFGKKDYMDECKEYTCHMIAQATEQADVLAMPIESGKEEAESQLLRQIKAGERMLVTGLYRNTFRQYYYQVDDCGTVGYVPAESLTPEIFLWDGIHQQDLQLPLKLTEGEDFCLEGKIYGQDSEVAAVRMEIRAQDPALNPEVCQSYSLEKPSGQYDLSKDGFDDALDFGNLSDGCYRLDVLATRQYTYIKNGRVSQMEREIPVYSDIFYIGRITDTRNIEKSGVEEIVSDGWFYRNGTLYCYKDGEPVVGWICYNGMDYYLQEDGSITTGWAAVNGKVRYFSNTGVMQTGWVTTQRGTCYLLKNGVMAKGVHTIDGQQYTFTSTGRLIENNT